MQAELAETAMREETVSLATKCKDEITAHVHCTHQLAVVEAQWEADRLQAMAQLATQSQTEHQEQVFRCFVVPRCRRMLENARAWLERLRLCFQSSTRFFQVYWL